MVYGSQSVAVQPQLHLPKLLSGLLLWSIWSLNEKLLRRGLHSSSEDKVSRPGIGSLGCKWQSLCVLRWFITVWLTSRFRKSSHSQASRFLSRGPWSAQRARLSFVLLLFFKERFILLRMNIPGLFPMILCGADLVMRPICTQRISPIWARQNMGLIFYRFVGYNWTFTANMLFTTCHATFTF